MSYQAILLCFSFDLFFPFENPFESKNFKSESYWICPVEYIFSRRVLLTKLLYPFDV
jgi:hypothetical protein